MNPAEKKPSVGRIVMYVPPEGDVPERHNGAEILPAIVVRTWPDSSYQNDEINLKVFTDGDSDTWRTSVPHSSDKEPNSWHWPEIK